ncbi:anti-sigma factor antagonist [Pseudonocardiaceae bacterium YIM PH 21723]|nr:anti-sigma factor antagonist [Pseudonocardiaceae bacterium YIM PH 21723]
MINVGTNDAGDGVVVVSVAGEVDLETAPDLEQSITDALNVPAARSVEVNLAAVSFLNSRGLSVLVSGSQRAEKAGIAFTVRGAQPAVAKVIEITGLTGVLCGPEA